LPLPAVCHLTTNLVCWCSFWWHAPIVTLPPTGKQFLILRATQRRAENRLSKSSEGQSASLGVKQPSGAHDLICIPVRQLGVCGRGAPSLRREWVCSLQLLLVLASAIFLGPECHVTHLVYSQIRDSPTWRARTLLFNPPE
jgi:hypothetical protein